MVEPHVVVLTVVSLAFIPEVIYVIRFFKRSAEDARLPKLTFRVNMVILLIGVLMLMVAIVYDVNYLNYKAPIRYEEWEKIELSDFRAIKRPSQTLYGHEEFAYISTEISYRFDNNMVEVVTLFHPSRSYTYKENIDDRSLLTHELYHLHITEYFSRLARKEIINTFDQLNRSKIIELINYYIEKEMVMQQEYDRETFHGYVLGKQKSWQKKVDSCLVSLDEFENTIINF